MKKIYYLTVLIICLLSSKPIYAKENTDIGQAEIKQLEGVVRLLKDEKQTQKLAEQLNNLLKAKKKLLQEQQSTIQAQTGINLILLFKRAQNALILKTQNFMESLISISTDYKKLEKSLLVKDNLYRFLDIILKLALVGIISIVLLVLLKKSTKHLNKQLETERNSGYAQKIKAAGIRLLVNTYPVLIWAVAVGILIWLILPQDTSVLLVQILAAFIIYRISLCTVSAFISPKNADLRVIVLSDKGANYIFIWCRRLLLFSLWAYISIRLSNQFVLAELVFVLKTLYKISIVFMIVLIFVQCRKQISAQFSIEIEDNDSAFTIRTKRFFNLILDKLYLLVLVYFSVIALLSILGFETLRRYLVYSSLKTLVIIVIFTGLWRLWNLLFKRLFSISENIRQRFPGVEEQVNRYIIVLSRTGHFFIVMIGFMLALEMWQVNVFGLSAIYYDYIFRLIRIPFILGASIVFTQAGGLLIKKFEYNIIEKRKKQENIPDIEIEKQVNTISGILRKAVFTAIWVIAVLMIVRELGFDIAPALAGAGIFGVAIGFGTQNLVRDIISGLFMITENQVRVGDVAILNGTGGLVTAVNLRTTVLRSLDGTVHIFPNGSITTVSNMTNEFSYYVFELGVAYKEDVDKVIQVLKQLSDEIMADESFAPDILEPLEVLGLDKFDDSAVIIKARIKTLPIKQWGIGREMNKRIKKRFDELGIEIPFPQRTLYFGEGSQPIKMKMEQTG